MTGGRAEPAVIADVDAAVRQDVLQKATPTLFGSEGTDLGLISGRCLGRKRDVAILQREDALRADGHAKESRGTIAEGLRATADGPTVHDPVLCPDVRRDLSAQVGFCQLVSDLGLEAYGEGLDVDEDVCA